MTILQKAKNLLADTEKALRELMQEEINAQRYAELGELASIADGLARLARGDSPFRESAPHLAVTDTVTPSIRKTPERRVSKKVSKRAPTIKRDYPHFERDDDKLVKVAWSKKRREEYEHRCPRAAVIAFVQHLQNQVKAGKVFAIDDLMPIPDDAGEDLPSYQIYLTLAWLRGVGVINKKGRDGYVLSKGHLSAEAFDSLWNDLPTRF